MLTVRLLPYLPTSQCKGFTMSNEPSPDQLNQIERRLEAVEQRLEELVTQEGDNSIENLYIADYPIGRIVSGAKQQAERAEMIAKNESNEETGSTPNQEVRSEMLPVQRMWVDLRQQNEHGLNKTQRRAVTIYGGFLHSATDTEPDEAPVPFTQIDCTGQTYLLKSTDAKEYLKQAPQAPTDGDVYSTTVKRAFRELQRLSKRDDCECRSIDECSHGLILFDTRRGANAVQVHKSDLHSVLERIEQSATSDDSNIQQQA
jgi:hypothetical protein